MSAHDIAEELCECESCVAEDLALLSGSPDPLALIALAPSPRPAGGSAGGTEPEGRPLMGGRASFEATT